MTFGRWYSADPDRFAPRPCATLTVMPESPPILTAELLSIGSELTVGETRDTNAGDLARSLTELGVGVHRISALPDDLTVLTEAFVTALGRSDLVVSTGGLGPTPDDLTREAIAALTGETPVIDPELENWLRSLWSRRSMAFPELNLKQAWLLPSVSALANPNGTAPGWWVDRPDGRVVVALPGPPREMGPMWANEVLPRLAQRSIGREVARRTFRLAGIGESQLADELGDSILRRTNPIVATYARADAVDVRVSAVAEPASGGRPARSATELVEEAAAAVLAVVRAHVWAEGETTWADAIGAEIEAQGGKLAILEVGTGGSLAGLLGDRPWLAFSETMAADAPPATHHGDPRDGAGRVATTPAAGLEALARRAAELGGANIAVGVRVGSRGQDTTVAVVVVTQDRVHRERRVVFLGGANGRVRAGLAAAHVLLTELRRTPAERSQATAARPG
jgi:nicotinamide-nucleotide amidase